MALVFFVTARTEPVNPGPDKFGSCTRIILYDAPSQKAADRWAKGYVEHLLLDDHPEQKLAKLQVLPVYDRVLTSAGDEKIDWPSFVEHANATNRRDDHSAELGSSLRFSPAKAHEPAAPANADNDLEYLKKYLKKHIPDAKRFNWNPKKQYYYVLYHDKRAFIVQAINMFLASRPYVRTFTGTPDGEHNVSIITFPGAKSYHE
jgi:hypothetical protein